MSYKVSIIISVYNIEQYIVRCLDSIINQSYTDLEIIPIDDGSTDGSGAILDDYAAADGRIRVVHQKNGGLISTRRSGLMSASSDFIFFVDGDDWLELDAVELLVRKQLETDADIVIGSYQRTNGSEIIKSHPVFQNNALTAPEYIPMFIQTKPPYIISWSIWMKLYRRSLFPDDFASFGRHLTMGEDVVCNCQLFPYVNKIATEPRAIYNYYQRDTSIANTHKYTIEYDIVLFDAMTGAMGTEIANRYKSVINGRLVSSVIAIFYAHLNYFSESYIGTKAYAHIKTVIESDANIAKQLSLKQRVLMAMMYKPFWLNFMVKIDRLIKHGKWCRLTPIGSRYEVKNNL